MQGAKLAHHKAIQSGFSNILVCASSRRPEKRSIDLEGSPEMEQLVKADAPAGKADGGLTSAGLKVLVLLAFQNCVKNLVMRAAVQDSHFMYSAAVIATEGTKCTSSILYVLCTGGTPAGIYTYLRTEWRKFALLAVPAGIYNFQQTLEYVALRNLNAALFSVLVQTKLLTTAIFSASLLGKRLRRAQLISLVLLTTGVMLAQLRPDRGDSSEGESLTTGILATLGIALSSGFAAVYTEKVIKRGSQPTDAAVPPVGGLAYFQIQLAMTSLVIEGGWAFITDGATIRERGLWDGFDYKACISVFNSAAGGLTVAAVLKHADAVLKGYATAVSVVLTGLLSMLFFGTTLSVEYALGMVNVFAAIVLYNVRDLDAHAW